MAGIMDSDYDNPYDAFAKVRELNNCPCATCVKYQGEYDCIAEECHLVYCSDGKTRLVDKDKGCGWWERDEFEGITDVN